MSKRRKRRLLLPTLLVVGACAFAGWLVSGVRAIGTQEAAKTYIRYEKPQRLSSVLNELEKRKLLRNALATRVLAWILRADGVVSAGSYMISPGQNGEEILKQLRRPMRQMVRLPETNWARRTANVLAAHHVTSADEYMELVHSPLEFAGEVSFPLPKDSLEGYLYPDTYELPPLLGARPVILKQLKAFEKRIWERQDKPNDLKHTLIVASLVQLEAGKDADRPMIAGVIENRLKKKMPLQIDATILYAIQKFRRLKFRDYREVKSPYNTYLIKGLPPGPICSPDEKDFDAALHPAKHNFLFYVALPNGQSIYSATYKEHLKNIRLRKAALKALKP